MGDGGIADILSIAASGAMPQQGGQGGGNLTQMGPAPLTAPSPIPQFQPPIQQPSQTHFPTVGSRKRYDQQEAFGSIAKLVKAGSDYIQAKKNRALQSDIERLMNAQQGLTEAQNILKQNPNDENAKKAVDTNNGIINDIRHDPKKSKQLQKAFNIDLFGDGKNKHENKALADAWKSFDEKSKTDKSAQNPISSMMPQRQQIDPQLARQAQMIQLGLAPKAGETLRANMESIKILTEAKTAQDRIAGQEKAAQILADARIQGADKMVEAANVRALGTQTAAMIRFKADTIKTNTMLKAVEMRVDAMRDIAGSKSGDKTVGNLVKEANIVKGRAGDLAKKRKDIEDQLNKYATSSGIYGKVTGALGMGSKSTMSKAESEQLQKDLFTLKLEQNSVEGQWKDLQMRTNTYIKLGQMPDPDTVSDPEGLFEEDTVNQ